MKKSPKIIKLTESQLNEIIKNVVEEQTSSLGGGIGSFMDSVMGKTDTAAAKPTKPNINPKNLKFGDGGKNSPNLKNDVIALQSALMKAGLLKINAPTGYFGTKTKAALDAYNGTATSTPAGKQNPNAGFILVWAFPEYEPKVDGKGKFAQFMGSLVRLASGGGKEGTYGKMGHGGCVVVKKDGTSILHEFGRYPGAKNKDYGKVLTTQLGRIGQIQNGKLVNAGQVASRAKARTYSPGPTMKMTVALLSLPNPDGAESYASVKDREYSAADFFHGGAANCGTFARDVAEAGGVNAPSFCFPTPISVVESFRSQALEMFTV